MHPMFPAARLAVIGIALALAVITLHHAQEPPSEPAPLRGAQLRNLPAPGFELTTLAGKNVSLEKYTGWILVLYFIGSDDEEASGLMREMEFFHSRGHEQELAYLGIATLPRQAATAMAKREGIHHELAVDPDGTVTLRYLGRTGAGIVIVDHHGIVRFFRDGFRSSLRESIRSMLSDLIRELRRTLRSRLRLHLPWRTLPAVPAFSGVDLEGHRRTVEDYRGKPLLVYFFEQDCEFCRRIAPKLSEVYFRYKDRIQFLGVASGDPQGDLKRQMAIQGLEFPVLLDPEQAIRRSFGCLAGNPDIIWVDSQAQVRWREFGAPENLGSILDLEARVILGNARRDDLSPTEYAGYRYCRVCHEPEFRDWLATPHATSLVSLSTGKGWTKQECIACHVTGYQQPGGYNDSTDAEMAHVQCESCHGAGGGHGHTAVSTESYAARCRRCHLGQYELQQDLSVSLSWMNHRDTPGAPTLFAYRPERITEMQRLRRARLNSVTFHRGTGYVGSERCASCHAKVFQAWKSTPHGGALETLRRVGKQDEKECLSCHTTAYGELTGYRGPSTPQLAGVGCESCHGPGADHAAAADHASPASIYGLAPRCPTCQPEAVCRACHDPENDPDFHMPERLARTVHPPAR